MTAVRYTLSDIPENHFDGGRNLTRACGAGPTLQEVVADAIERVQEAESAQHDPVADIAACRALTDFEDKMMLFVESKGLYRYESSSASADDSDLVLKPTSVSGNGRWLMMWRLSPVHASQHSHGGADALTSVPGNAVMGATAVTAANVGAWLPTSDEKAGLSANTPSGANPVQTQTQLTNHTGIATAHHTNANDPTAAEKSGIAGLSATNVALGSTSEIVVETADGNIDARRVVMVDATGQHVEGTLQTTRIIGINADNAAVAPAAPVNIRVTGKGTCMAACPIRAGRLLKCSDDGRVSHLIDAGTAGDVIDTGVGLAYTNQPANDNITLVSASALDLQNVDCIGTTNATDNVVVEVIALTGLAPVTTVKADWGQMLAFRFDAVLNGNVTITETSGGLNIVVIPAGATESGIIHVPAADQGAHNAAPTVVADGATVQQVGIRYTQNDGATVAYQGDTLAGAAVQTMGVAAILVDELYIGSVEVARTVTLAVGAGTDTFGMKVGRSTNPAAARGDAVAMVVDF